jgi:hypothetical protein
VRRPEARVARAFHEKPLRRQLFFLFAGRENPPCIAQVPSGARVCCAAKRTLDGFCAIHYTAHPAKKKISRCSLPLVEFARQPSIRTQKWTMRSGALCHTGECCYLDFGLQEGSGKLLSVTPGRARSHSFPASTISHRRDRQFVMPRPAPEGVARSCCYAADRRPRR